MNRSTMFAAVLLLPTLPISMQAGATQCGPDALTTYPAATYADAFPVHGVAGDRSVLFATQPSAGIERDVGVRVARRLDGAQLGDLPAPPTGFSNPLSMQITEFSGSPFHSHGELIVSDVRVPPGVAQVAPVPAELYRYNYGHGWLQGFSAEHVDTWSLPVNTALPGQGLPNGFAYLGSFDVLPDGSYVLTDTFTGAIWTAPHFGASPTLALIEPDFGPAPVDVISGIQRDGEGGFRDYQQILPAPPGGPSIGPGIESITYAELTDEVCVSPTALGGLYCIDRGALFDAQMPPFAKSNAVREVLPPIEGLSDLTDGLVVDEHQAHSRWLYWHRAPSDSTPFPGSDKNTLRRVDLVSGQHEVVAQSNTCFDWTYEIATVPPYFPNSQLSFIVSSMGQGPNNPDINLNLGGEPAYVGPSLIPVTIAIDY